MPHAAGIIEIPELRGRVRIFHDRDQAGKILSGMLREYGSTPALVFAIPAGGVPVAAKVSLRLGLPLEVAVVSKITLPWNTEAGYGAVAFDGTVRLNSDFLARLNMSRREVEEGIAKTREKVERRVRLVRGERPFPSLAGKTVILIDDGLASGVTMRANVEAMGHYGARSLVVAVPTGHLEAVTRLSHEVEAVYCANVRSGLNFAVAEAYERWSDVDEHEVLEILARVPPNPRLPPENEAH